MVTILSCSGWSDVLFSPSLLFTQLCFLFYSSSGGSSLEKPAYSAHSNTDDAFLHSTFSFQTSFHFFFLTSDLNSLSLKHSYDVAQFNSSKTLLLPDNQLTFECSFLKPQETTNITGISLPSSVSWNPHISITAKNYLKKNKQCF